MIKREDDMSPPPDFPNPDRPGEIWMNLRLDLEASRDRLNHALNILVKLGDYVRAEIIQSALTYHYQALHTLKNQYDREEKEPNGTD